MSRLAHRNGAHISRHQDECSQNREQQDNVGRITLEHLDNLVPNGPRTLLKR